MRIDWFLKGLKHKLEHETNCEWRTELFNDSHESIIVVEFVVLMPIIFAYVNQSKENPVFGNEIYMSRYYNTYGKVMERIGHLIQLYTVQGKKVAIHESEMRLVLSETFKNMPFKWKLLEFDYDDELQNKERLSSSIFPMYLTVSFESENFI